MNLTGETYKERVGCQLSEWDKGNPIHNDIDGECCPDFSCCQPKLLQPKEVREAFAAAEKEGKEDLKMSMLGTFLGTVIENHLSKKEDPPKVHIAGSEKAREQ